MKIQGAVIKEQGVTFAIIVVKPNVLQNADQADDVQNGARSIFGLMPVVLMAQDTRGVPRYYGRKDIVNFLSKVHPSRIPWKEYTVA